MPFEKGHNKATGRPKGSSNKATSKVRESFTKLLEDNLEQLKSDFEELEPKDRIKLFLDLSKYVVPQLKQKDINQDIKHTINDFNIKDVLKFDNS